MAQVFTDSFPRYKAITTSDTVNYDGSTWSAAPAGNAHPLVADAIFVGGAGIVVAVAENGSTCNFTAAAGTILPIRTIRVNAGTTTATLLVALYASP